MANRNYWLETTEERYVILVPQFQDEDVICYDREDGDVPDDLEFNLTNPLDLDTMAEVDQVCEDFDVTLKNRELVAITFRRD